MDDAQEIARLNRQLGRLIEGVDRLEKALSGPYEAHSALAENAKDEAVEHASEILRGTVEAIRKPDLLPKPGDYVWVGRIGESWVVATAEAGGHLMCCGWPCSSVPVAECELEYVCPEEESRKLVRELVELRGDNGSSDPRASAARRLYGPWLGEETT